MPSAQQTPEGNQTPMRGAGQDFQALKTLVEVSLNLKQNAQSPTNGQQEGARPRPRGTHSPTASIVLLGMRGVGKTTLGLIASTFLSRDFLDADRLFEQVFRCSVKDLVAEKGFAYFRERESALLEQLLTVHGEGKIIVLGGGVVEREDNRRRLQEYARTRGPVFHVERDLEEVFAYLHNPNAKSTWATLEEGYRAVWERRAAWYEECSNLTLVALSPSPSVHPSLVLKRAEISLQRFLGALLGSPSPSSPPFDLSNMSRRSTALVIVGDDPILRSAKLLEVASRGVDALEIRVDTLAGCHSTPTKHSPSSASQPPDAPTVTTSRAASPTQVAGNPDPFFVSLRVGALRQNSPLPLLYTVQTFGQGGCFTGSRDDYIRLVEHGFRLACDFVDVELGLEDDEIELLMQSKSRGSRTIMSWRWDSPVAWNSAEVGAVYERAVRLGADIVRLEQPASSPASSFELALLQDRLAKTAGVPLIGINTGATGQMSRIFNRLLTPVSHPSLAEAASLAREGVHSFAELQQALKLTGLHSPRTIYDLAATERMSCWVGDAPSVGSSNERLQDAIASLALPFLFTRRPSSTYLPSLIEQGDFGGALLPPRVDLAAYPSHIPLSLAASTIGYADTLVPSSTPSIPFDEPAPSGPPSPPTLDNLRSLALQHLLRSHLSPANAVGRHSSAVVIDAYGQAGREALFALSQLGVRKIFVLGSDGAALKVYEGTVISIASLADVDQSGLRHLPAIVLSCSANMPSLSPTLEGSSTPGVVLCMEGEGQTSMEGEGGRTLMDVDDDGDGWIRLGRKELKEEVVRRQFFALTGKRMPSRGDEVVHCLM
ncbi:type I 3-dehydroquinase-domain-containing protein [Leucosporidium creatinivorum]|uniref:Type I 3-dehydroquinase-domain-containing protein n=1 Tax=Leucosporidium creatinivorum TaxID=106004 RepID=A0A1Y2DAB5_9BASI|nr:type I 3-dehydroquinase-domain-containing protein [Leucosporidium creatinivorum]